MSKGKEAGKIQVYVRVRPFTEREKEKREPNAIEIHQEHSLIRVLDPRSRTNYFFDGVFSPEASNQELYFKVGKPLVYAALNGYKGTLLTYGQTGTGKTFTLLSDDGITTRVVQHCFEKIDNDEIHTYKVMCSFLQVYQEKVYDLLNPRLIMDLPVREHPKKGVYVANLTQHEVKSAGDVFALLEIGKQHLVIAETKMVRQSSRSHSIMQLIIERRLKEHIANEKPPSQNETSASHEAVQESIMAVDETINNLIKELKQERKSHHKRERECLKELMEKELNKGNNFEGDLIVKGKINLCDLAGSERLTKTKAEGVRLTEAKYLNTSLLELGNVIHALARGHKRHVPYRNSTLTRLLQDCLGDNGKTNFIICIAPSLGEVNETKCSLNFGLRAMRITNVARLNVEVDYKVLAERLAKKIEDHDIKYKFEKLEYLREIQRLKSAISCYQESENFAGKDHEKLVSVIANLSKSVQREKEEKTSLQTELVCLKRQASQPIGSAPDVEAVLLAELMSMELLANLQTPDATKSILSDSSLPAKVKSHLALADTQEALLNNAGCFLQLLDLHLDSDQDGSGRKLAAPAAKDYVQFNFSRAGAVELFSKDCSIKISPRGAPQEPCLSLPMYNPASDEATTGLAGGVRRMLGKLIGRETKEKTSPDAQPKSRACADTQCSVPGSDIKASGHDQEEAMIKTKALLKQLTSSKEKVEQQVLNLMSSLFDEQIVRKEGQSPQWNELGKKLTRLIMFRRNNMPGLSDADMWANSEDLNSILENCLRFVIIDKALLACLLVIELLDLRQACGKLGDRRQFLSTPDKSAAQETTLPSNKPLDETLGEKGNMKSSASNGNKKVAFNGQDIWMNMPKGAISPRREKLRNLKHGKTELEKEISDTHEDTTKLETELFSSMEDKTKVEEELFGMKHHVTKLRSELFHLKLEKSNLESDVKRSKSQENLHQCTNSDEEKLAAESPKEALRGYPELSDVMEASHESNDSENSSQMSDGNETREAFLKTCMENISKIYTLMPNPDEEIASEDELSDDQEPTLSDANIDDSDEEIVITKLARSLRSPCTSTAKERTLEASSPTKSGKKEAVSNFSQKHKVNTGNDNSEDLKSKSKEALVKQIQELKRKLHKAEQELAIAQETSEDLEEELDHKKGQLAEAQGTITNLENQVVEEKETCEQVRQEYFNIKTQNEILDVKMKALRSELERVLVRENNALSSVFKPAEGSRKDNPPLSPTKTSTKSPLKSPGKAKVSKIDLRTPPPKRFTLNEMEMVSLIEENAELKVKLGKATQEKARLEKSQKLVEEKSTKMKVALQASEDACSRFKDELANLSKEKIKLTGEVTDLRNNSSKIAEELQKYREKSSRLEKDIEAIAYMSTRLEKDNKTLEMEISKMESELSSCKSKHEVSSQECERLNQERVQVEKECEKALHDLETLRKEKRQLLESEVSEQKRLNSNLQKELAGMAEYQEALENEYSKAKNAEDRLKQELAKVSHRVTEMETGLAVGTQNTLDEGAITNHREGNLSFDHVFNRNPYKPEVIKEKKSFTGTPIKKFYTITHTSEDEIGDTSSSIAESPADESKQVEHENQLLKLENGYLQQQLAESEHVLALYRQDLETAHDLIDKLQADVKVFAVDTKTAVAEDDCKTPSDKDDTIKEIGDYSDNANDEYKLLEEKHAELTREYEILRQQYQEALTDKENVTDGVTIETPSLMEDVQTKYQTEKEVSSSNQDVSGLQERIRQLEADNVQLKITAEELSRNEKAKTALMKSLEDAKRVKISLEERINKLESENKALQLKHDVPAMQKDNKSVRRRSLNNQVTRLKDTNEALKAEVLQCTGGCHNHPLQLQHATKENEVEKTAGVSEMKMRKLEEDLLKVTSEKLTLEFELRSAYNDCERLKNDLHQSESERNLLNTQLNDNIERAANLEIRLMEMRCSCDTIKDEINTLKSQKRQERFHLHEASVCKEILEKRLEDALRENNFLHHELDTMREERKENEKNSARLEKEKDHLTKEIDDVKTEIRRLEQDFEESKVRTSQIGEKENSNMYKGTIKQEHCRLEKLTEYKILHEKDQEQLMVLREEVEKLTAYHNQMKIELKDIIDVKENLEKQIENMKTAPVENGDPSDVKEDEEIINTQNENAPECERTTFDTLEIEKHTKLLEKEKGLLEKELTRVQEECNKLKEKLEIIRHASQNEQTQEKRRKELEGKQEQLEKDLQELRELNQKLEIECDDSHKLIQELEIKTKALESLQNELHCFHEENDRLTHEVEIIHNTSKAMTDNQRTKESLEAENTLLKQELESFNDRNKKLQMQTEDTSKELLTLKEQKKNISQSTEKKNISLKSEVEKFQKMQQHLETELATTREKVTEREIANESLKKENKAVKGRIKSLEQRNEELRRKDEKKKACTAENKSKAKSKHGQSVIKESNEAPTICHEGNEKDLREKVEQMEHEKAHLEEQLNILKKKVNTECAAVSKAPGVTIATQTTEFQPVDQAVKTLNNNAMTTAIENHDPKSNKESAPLTEEYKTGISLMAKEKLLLEKKATLFARAQMQLEQSFAKALKENAALKAKVGEADNVLEILRDKVHELEKNNSTSLSVVDLKNNVLMSSDSESDSNDEDPSNDGTKEGQNEGRSASNNTNSEEVNKSAKSNEEGCLSNPTQSEVDQLRKEKEQLIKELKGLKSQKEHMESDMKQKEDLRISAEKDREVQQSVMNDDHSCLANSTQTEVDQPRSETEQLIEEQKSLKSQKEDMESVLEQQNKDLENPTETQREQESTYNNDSGCVLNPTKSEVDLLQSKQEHLLKAPAGLKSQNEDMESVLKQKKEDLNVPIETEREVQHSVMSDDHCCLSKPTKSEVDQLRSEKEQLIKDLEVLKSQKVQLETDLKQKKENVGAPTETDTPFEKLKEENALLKRERKSLLEELEAGKNERNLTESELRHNKELCLKQEQEIKLLLSSYSQEKESLLKEVDNTRTDCRKAKEKLRELQQIESDFEDIRKKSNEAENLITELEKDLLSQTEMKNELRRELQTCKNELKKIEHLETQLRSSRIENEDLHTTNLQLTEQVKKWKDENESKNIRLQFQKIEKQKKNSLNANPSMKRFQNQCVQTESAIDHYDCVNELLEDNTASSSVKCDSDNTNHGDKNNVGGVKNNSEDVENNMDGVENDVEGHEHLPHASAMEIKFYEQNRTGGSEPGGLDATEMAQTDQTNKEIGETATYNTETSFSGVPIPIIIVSHVDDIKTSNSENTAILSLCIEDFESHSPNDQSTPDEEKEQFKPSVNNGNTREIQGEPLDDINKPSVQNDEMSLEVNLPQAIKDIQISNTKLGLQASTKPTQDTANNVYEFGQQRADDDPRDVLNNQALELDWRLETHFTNTDKDTSKSRRELEWTISSLASELEQRVEDHEKNQLEIGLLVEEQLSMKREIISLTSECASLRAKADTLRTQNEAVLKEQILNDEELEELQQNLKDLKQEKNLIDEAKKNLESQKARLEIELSDAIETREAMERELLRIRTENIDVSKHRLEAQLRDISERYTKLETVLSCILDENSKMTAELSALQAENNMLKSFKIMEITDNFTQFSPRTTEDESDGEGTRSTRREKSGITTLFTSKANLTLSLGNNLTNLPSTSSPSSSEHQRKLNSSVTPNQAQDDQGPNTPTASHSKGTELCAEPVENTFHQEGKSRKRDQVLFTGTNDHEVAKTRHKASSVGTPTLPTKFESKVTGSSFKDTAVMENKLSHRKQQKNTSKKSSTLNQKYDASEDATKRDSDDNDSSMEIHTSSSLVSVTDLDISISSDQISSEDSSIVGPEIRVLQKMQKELSETKCSNVLVKNELSIIRKHNSDLQNQVQKLLSRNNHLKMKMCDRTLSVKRMEKEVSSIKDENNRLQQQALVLHEEMTRVEKEKAKFERNMSSTKSENKRLKSDLSNIKAESYRTMKELVNLQSENRMLQLEIEKVKEEARSFKGDFSDESVSQELSLWGSISHGDFRSTSRRSLQERPAKPDPVYLQQRASSELAFSQHQRLPEHPETPELSPLNLSKELNEQHGDGGNYGKGLASSADTISVNSTGGSRLADPVSRRGSPLSFTSEAGLPSEPNDRDENEHNGEKVEEQEQDEEEGKGKSRKKIKTILRKLQHSKKSKSSK